MEDTDDPSLTSFSGRAADSPSSGPWWVEAASRLANVPIRVRLGCSSPAGEFWIAVPLPARRQWRQTPKPLAGPTPASLGLSRQPTWQSRLLDRLLADAEVQLQLKQSNMHLTEETVARWATAKKGDISLAEDSLRAHICWRAESVPGGVISEVSIGNALADQKVFLQGCDTHGRAVIVVLGVRHLTQTRDLEETIRLIIYVLDHAVAASDPVKNPARQIICLLDLGGVRMRNIDVAALRAIFDLVQHHYPEHLAMMWFLNAPFIFRGAWKGISPFIQPATKAKIEFLSGDHGRTVLQDNISLQVLPEEYGGDAPLMPIDRAVAQQRKRSHALASQSRPALEKVPDAAKGRAAAGGRAVKRWAGAAWRFARRHNPGPPVAATVKGWFGTRPPGTPPAPPGRIRTSFSRVSRAVSTRLTTPRGLGSPRAGGASLLRSLSRVTPAAVASLVVVVLRTLSQGAAQALQWAWHRMHGAPAAQLDHSHVLRLDGLAPIAEGRESSSAASQAVSALDKPARQQHSSTSGAADGADAIGAAAERVNDGSTGWRGDVRGNPSQSIATGQTHTSGRPAHLDASKLLKGSFAWPIAQHQVS